MAKAKQSDPLHSILKNLREEAEAAPELEDDAIGKFWVVLKPTGDSTIEDVCFAADVPTMIAMGASGTEPASVAGVYKKEAQAKKAAEAALKQRDDEMGDIAAKHGFDFTKISAGDWKKVLKAAKIGDTPVRSAEGWKWMGPDILIVTGNDPITGRYYSQGGRQDEADYASAIGIEGKADLVQAAADMIKKLGDSKGESPGERDFI